MSICPEHEQLKADTKEIKEDVKTILARMGTGDVTFATIGVRIDFLEKVVYGALAIALSAVGIAIMGLVMRA